MRRALVIFGTLLVLWSVLTEINHVLSPWHVYLWLGGLFVTYSALTLALRPGVLATLAAGMIFDAAAPVPFGTHAVLFAAAHVVIFNIRDRVPRDETVGRVVIALLANLALFLVFSFFLIARLPAPAAAWPRLIVDLICSQLLIATLGPWFFALQAGALEISKPFTTRYGRDVE